MTITLLSLPGSAFPSKGFFGLDIPHLDKIIHVILFGGIISFWSLYYFQKNTGRANWRFKILVTAIAAILLGICMEFIQLKFIPNRSFDSGDIVANTVSTVVFGTFFFFRKHKH